jgi:glycosyltransferase involved in cell wall biosynthesis
MNDVGQQLAAATDWLDHFKERNGRRPTVLHIGNIANAAYLNAAMLNDAGMDCDVLCYEYYHIMGCPEWESAVFDSHEVDANRPRWSEIDLHGFQRPRWFAQGALATCIDYLIARRTNDRRTDELWRLLQAEQEDPELAERAEPAGGKSNYLAAVIESRIGDLVTAFRIDFPLRPDQLSAEELTASLSLSKEYFAPLRRLCSLYDVVIGYSTDGVVPLSVGKRPYLTYEHGTIRALPFEDNTDGRLCALTYSRADLSFITNCDTVIAAERLKLSDYRFVPHPINEQVVADPEPASLRNRLCQELQADFLVFHPARQHWEPQRHPSWEKGNDIFLEGFARFVKTTRPRAAAILVDWGKTVARSRVLIDELGIADRVLWITPQNAAGMAAYIQASDVLADQFFLGAWGSTMPRALYLGTPAMIYVNESIHRWCFPEMPPVVNAGTSDTVNLGLCRLIDEDCRREISAAGRCWYEKYHSSKVITECFSRAIRDVLVQTVERRFYDAARELRDAAAICRQLRDTQIPLHREFRERQVAADASGCEVRTSLAELNNELQYIKWQLASVLETSDGMKPLIPTMQKANRLARILFRPPYRAARFLYRLFHQRSA